MAKRSEKLKGMGMPKNSMAENEAMEDLDLEMMEEEDMMAEEEPAAEEEMEMEADDMFADIDDDMLIEEMQKRGLELPEMEEDMMAEDEPMEEDEEEDMFA